MLEHEDFKNLLKFDINYEKKLSFLFQMNIDKIDISSYVAPSDIELIANKTDQSLELIVRNAGFNLECEMSIDLFGLNFMRDFSIGVQEVDYAIKIQSVDPENIRLLNAEITDLKLSHLDTSGFILDKFLQLEKLELNEIIFVLIKLQPAFIKNYISEQIDSEMKKVQPMLQHAQISDSIDLDLTSFTELISEVDDKNLYINLAGWFENTRVHSIHPLNIGEGLYIQKKENQTKFKNQITIHQSMLTSLLNALASTKKVFVFENQMAVDQLSSFMREFKSYYEEQYDNVTFEFHIQLDTDPSKPVVLVLETFLHNKLFDLNIINFDVSNVQKIADNCGLYGRDYEGLFETMLQIAKQVIDDNLKDGIPAIDQVFKGRYALYKQEMSGLEINHSFLDHFIFIGF
eukprot:403335810